MFANHHAVPEVTMLLICTSGSRSKVAVQLLVRAGHDRATSVNGGTAAWTRAGLPVER